MRINQYIAQSGYSSRKKAEIIIQENRVKINGNRASLQDFVTSNDSVTIDNMPIKLVETYTYLILYKPRGVTTTMNPEIEANILSLLPKGIRLNPVGRLDKSTEGLLLFTNNNQLINRLLQGKHSVVKTYRVTVNKEIKNSFIQDLKNGVRIYNPRIKDYQVTQQAKVKQLNSYEFLISLTEGLNRQIRRMCKRCGYQVTHLIRISFGELNLTGLNPTEYRYLLPNEIKNIEKTH